MVYSLSQPLFDTKPIRNVSTMRFSDPSEINTWYIVGHIPRNPFRKSYLWDTTKNIKYFLKRLESGSQLNSWHRWEKTDVELLASLFR